MVSLHEEGQRPEEEKGKTRSRHTLIGSQKAHATGEFVIVA